MSTPALLVTADFSDCSPEVVRHAADLAETLGARLVMLHVVELPSGISADTRIRPNPNGPETTALTFLEQQARDTLGDYAQAVRAEFGDLAVDMRVAQGPVVDQILAAAEEVDARMIVMGTHGRHGLSRMMLGSVAERVIRSSERPVLTLRTEHKPTCDARSCAWCNTHVTWAQSRIRAELDG